MRFCLNIVWSNVKLSIFYNYKKNGNVEHNFSKASDVSEKPNNIPYKTQSHLESSQHSQSDETNFSYTLHIYFVRVQQLHFIEMVLYVLVEYVDNCGIDVYHLYLSTYCSNDCLSSH